MRRLNRKKSEIRELHLQLISTKNEVERLRVWIRKFKISEPSFLDRYVLQCVSNVDYRHRTRNCRSSCGPISKRRIPSVRSCFACPARIRLFRRRCVCACVLIGRMIRCTAL